MRADLARILAHPIAHRGLHDRSLGVIENTAQAAEAAITGGFGIECDVQRSGDGEAMVFHDETLDRLTGATGRVDGLAALVLAKIKLRDSDDTIPALPDFLARIAGRTPLVIEIKSDFDQDLRLTDRVIDLVATYDGLVALKSFDPAIVARCRRRGVACPVGLIGPMAVNDPFPEIDRDQVDFVSWNIQALRDLRGRLADIPAMSWTVRGPDQQALATSLKAQSVFERFIPL